MTLSTLSPVSPAAGTSRSRRLSSRHSAHDAVLGPGRSGGPSGRRISHMAIGDAAAKLQLATPRNSRNRVRQFWYTLLKPKLNWDQNRPSDWPSMRNLKIWTFRFKLARQSVMSVSITEPIL